MRKRKKYQTKRKMFLSYIMIPILLLTVISGLFLFVYSEMSRRRVISFENTIAENIDQEFKSTMDKLLQSSAQYSMTPWVARLKYLQKIPELMTQNITASDISDYASTISLNEINDNIVESIYIYYSLGSFGVSSCGKVSWLEYVNFYQVQCEDAEFLSGAFLQENNQKTIYHHASLVKNGKRVTGFYMVQSIPLENTYSGEVNLLFFIPYEKLCTYMENLADEGTEAIYLTDGQSIIYTNAVEHEILKPGMPITAFQTEDKGFCYSSKLGAYYAEYTKQGMDIGLIQVLDNDFIERDFSIFVEWLLMGYLVLLCLIILIAGRITKYHYQPLEHIMNMLEEEAVQDDTTINEYQIIEKALEELDSQKKRLEVTVFEQNPLIEQYILHVLLSSNKPQNHEVKYINTMRQYAVYRCLVLQNSPQAGQYVKEIDTCLAIYPQIHTAFVAEGNYYIWVLSYGEEGLMEEIIDLLTQTFLDSGYQDAAMGMSMDHEDILHILSAYNQAVRALEYHFFYPEKKVIQLEEDGIKERDLGCTDFAVTQSSLEELSESIKVTDAERLFETYQAVLLYNFRTRAIHKEAYFAGVHRLNAQLLECFHYEDKENYIGQMELLEPENFASLDSFLQTFRLKMTLLMEKQGSKENAVLSARNQHISKYIEEHLTDANLSLSETARMMKYTPTYFGKYFKEQFGCPFQKYVAIKRIECAKDYLRQGKLSVQEIALSCGFTNDVTFRRTFKMYVGVTPSQYEREIEFGYK